LESAIERVLAAESVEKETKERKRDFMGVIEEFWMGWEG